MIVNHFQGHFLLVSCRFCWRWCGGTKETPIKQFHIKAKWCFLTSSLRFPFERSRRRKEELGLVILSKKKTFPSNISPGGLEWPQELLGESIQSAALSMAWQRNDFSTFYTSLVCTPKISNQIEIWKLHAFCI